MSQAIYRRSITSYPLMTVIIFLGAHLPLVLGMRAFPVLATAHVYLTLTFALLTTGRARTPEALVPFLGYIAACEPLWRTSGASFFHEGAKYAIAGLATLAMLRFKLLPRASKIPMACIVLLMPSLLMLPSFDRSAISFNLSGPLTLLITALLMTSWRLSPTVLLRTFIVMLAPSVGFAFLATFSTLTASSVNFYSSKIASAGLGSNQASSALALVGLVAFLHRCLDRGHQTLAWLLGLIGVWCMGQAALTFSRGGVVTTLGACAVTSFFLLRDRQSRSSTVLQVALVGALAIYLVIPLLASVTRGAITVRFTDTDLTGRDKLIEADLRAFRENPVFGVGPGQAKRYHVQAFNRQVPAHTEYSRVLAEHGLMGLIAMLLLGALIINRLARPGPLLLKAVSAGLISWTLLYMTHAAMRMAIPCLIMALGLSILTPPRVPKRRRTSPAAGWNRTVRNSVARPNPSWSPSPPGPPPLREGEAAQRSRRPFRDG